ncbi:MAG: hypothetical protein PHH01_02970 [Patescibacteria group bacterium]|nr:hypothetical protein [Patescibacteria group bacterium]
MKSKKIVFVFGLIFAWLILANGVVADTITDDPEKDLALNKDLKAAKTELQSGKQFLRDSRINWEKNRDAYFQDGSEANLANAKKYAKQLINQSIDLLDQYYDLLTVEINNLSGIEVSDKNSMISDLKNEKAWLQTQRVAITESNDALKITGVADTLDAYLQNKQPLFYRIIGIIAASRVNKTITINTDALDRFEAGLGILTDLNRTVGTPQNLFNQLSDQVAQAKEKYTAALNGFRSLNSVTTAQTDFESERSSLNQSRDLLTEAQTSRQNLITELKKIKGSKIGGSGELAAQGNGSFVISNNGSVSLKADGEVTLQLYDWAGDAEVTTTGNASIESADKKTTYRGFTEATITGKEYLILVKGSVTELSAEGGGRAFLSGTGTYQIEGGTAQSFEGANGVIFTISS